MSMCHTHTPPRHRRHLKSPRRGRVGETDTRLSVHDALSADTNGAGVRRGRQRDTAARQATPSLPKIVRTAKDARSPRPPCRRRDKRAAGAQERLPQQLHFDVHGGEVLDGRVERVAGGNVDDLLGLHRRLQGGVVRLERLNVPLSLKELRLDALREGGGGGKGGGVRRTRVGAGSAEDEGRGLGGETGRVEYREG